MRRGDEGRLPACRPQALIPNQAPWLRTPRLTLERLHPDHAVEMFAGLRDPTLYRYLPDQPPTTPEEVVERYRRIGTGCSPDGADLWCNWIMRRDSDGRCIGFVQATITEVARQTGRVLIGYMILPSYWRQGYGLETLTAMLDCLFDTYHCDVADALVDTRNAASLGLLSKLGFRIVGRIEDADFFAGVASHEYELSLDAADWARRRWTAV